MNERQGRTEKAPRGTRGLGRVYERRYGPAPKPGETDTRPVHWWVEIWRDGVQHRESAGTERADAVKLLKRRIGEMQNGTFAGRRGERVRLDDVALLLRADYRKNERRSLARAERAVRHLREHFGNARMLSLTSDRADAYIMARLDAGAKPGSVKRDLDVLGKMFTLAGPKPKGHGLLPYRVALPSIDVHNTRQGFFEDDELRRVLAHLKEHLRPVVEFAALTGWRRGEVLTLQWRQVDFKAGTVRLEPGTTKTREGRVFTFAVVPDLRDLLARQYQATMALERETGAEVPLVFHRRGKPLRNFDTRWRSACKAAGVPGRLFHDLRRTAARNLRRLGLSESDIMELCGWETRAMFKRYCIRDERGLAERLGRAVAEHRRPSGAGENPHVSRTFSPGDLGRDDG